MADATGAGGCRAGSYGIDSGEEDSGPKVDIVTSTYTS